MKCIVDSLENFEWVLFSHMSMNLFGLLHLNFLDGCQDPLSHRRIPTLPKLFAQESNITYKGNFIISGIGETPGGVSEIF